MLSPKTKTPKPKHKNQWHFIHWHLSVAFRPEIKIMAFLCYPTTVLFWNSQANPVNDNKKHFDRVFPGINHPSMQCCNITYI